MVEDDEEESDEKPEEFLRLCLDELLDRDDIDIVEAFEDVNEDEADCISSESHDVKDFSDEHEAFSSFLISRIILLEFRFRSKCLPRFL